MSVDSLSIDERGLSAAEVAERVARGAVNRVKDRTSRSVASIIRENVLTLFNAIIVAASVIVLLFGDLRDGIFGGVMIINAVIGIVSALSGRWTPSQSWMLRRRRSCVMGHSRRCPRATSCSTTSST